MSTVASPKTIVVFGASSRQGQALIQDLSASNTPSSVQYDLLALVRDPATPTAQRLGALPGVQLKQVRKDYMDDAAKTFAELGLQHGDVWGVFSVQGYVSEKQDVEQGKGIADASHQLGVHFFVYSGVDFGSPDIGADIFAPKRAVKEHMESLTPPTMSTVYLSPVQFMDNLLPTSPFMFRVSRTILLRHTFFTHPERKHQLVSIRDVGRAAAVAFLQPERWAGKTMRLAGDELTVKDIQAVYEGTMGQPVQETFSFFAGFVKWMVPFLGGMAKFYDEHGFNVDIPEFRREILPDAEDLRSFLERNKARR